MRQNFIHRRVIIKSNTGAVKLKTVIYADILVIINIMVNYLLLRASTAITGHSFKPIRFLLSSAAGGLFSLIIFVENISVAVNIITKLVFLAVMMLIAFEIKSGKVFIKCCAAFLAANFVFAGIMFAICTAFFPHSALYKNGVVYFDIDILTLTVSTVICYFTLSLIARFTKSRTPEKCIYTLEIFYENKSVTGKALFDSGNTLCDCFSGKPVIIAEKDFIAPLLEKTDIIDARNFRLIPFTTIKNGGALPAFSADKVRVFIGKNAIETSGIYIGVTEKKIISGGYSALIGTPFFDATETCTHSERGRKTDYEKNI